MKKCPYCKADVEDNSRFCLYCMKALNEKNVVLPPERKKRWGLIAAGVLLLTLVVALILIPWGTNAPRAAGETTAAPTTEGSAETSLPTTEPAATQGHTQPVAEVTPAAPTEAATKPASVTGDNTPQATTPPQETAPKATTPKATTPPAAEQTPSTTEATEVTAPTQPATEPAATEPQPEVSQAVFTYRSARTGDDFSAHYVNSGSDIVITGISQPASNGVYDIPSYIDGKKVIAIAGNAFSGSNARVVYLPATVRNIWNYAFTGCPLTDIYFRGNAIYAQFKAFPSGLTIHCSADCHDRNLRYYKNSAAYYDATWEEWNG